MPRTRAWLISKGYAPVQVIRPPQAYNPMLGPPDHKLIKHLRWQWGNTPGSKKAVVAAGITANIRKKHTFWYYQRAGRIAAIPWKMTGPYPEILCLHTVQSLRCARCPELPCCLHATLRGHSLYASSLCHLRPDIEKRHSNP